MNSTTDYDGIDTLTALEGADNYNNAIEGLLVGHGGVRAGSRVLDIGSGAGLFAKRMQKVGATVECVEQDRRLRVALTEAGFICHASLETVVGTFDSLVMINVLEHIEDDTEFLTSLRPLLGDHGTLFVFVPALQVLYSRFDRKIGHFRRYSEASLRRAVERSGYSIVAARGFDVLGILPALAFRLLRQETPRPWSIKAFDRWLFPVSTRLDRLTGERVGKNLWMTARNSG
jgi:SAM-dependent methyltransferase